MTTVNWRGKKLVYAFDMPVLLEHHVYGTLRGRMVGNYKSGIQTSIKDRRNYVKIELPLPNGCTTYAYFHLADGRLSIAGANEQ